jgi:penicillin amidase
MPIPLTLIRVVPPGAPLYLSLAAVVGLLGAVTTASVIRERSPWVAYALLTYAFAVLLIVTFRGRALLPPLAYLLPRLCRSLPRKIERQVIPGLEQQVTVNFDRYGVPVIIARSRLDAFRALGYVTARDRLFQMDLLRRSVAGRLSEIFGDATLDADIAQRGFGFRRVSEEILGQLGECERTVLQAYADGVTSFIQSAEPKPFECLVLKYVPEPWTRQDSILVMLGMMQTLCGDQSAERMMTVLRRSLTADVVNFLTPDTDVYSSVLLGGEGSNRPESPIPIRDLAALYRAARCNSQPLPGTLVRPDTIPIGSNGWVVAGSKTRDGVSILANDLHLSHTVPNHWYRASLQYDGIELTGVVTPGIPLFVAGSNGRIAWGVTNAAADCLDLVAIEERQDSVNEYLTPEGWRQFQSVKETIGVRGRAPHAAEVLTTIWGPVSSQLLMGRRVALCWTALDPSAINLALMHFDTAARVEEAIAIAQSFAGPPLSVLAADDAGRIGWTLSGKIPVRGGFDGSSAQSWANPGVGWNGYVPADQLPSLINPARGFLAAANNQIVGKEYPYALGHNFANGYRARRINHRLRELDDINEQTLHDLQLDITAGFYEFYRDLALAILSEGTPALTSELEEIRTMVTRWNGKADRDSKAMGVLVRFRDGLAREMFAPIVAPCLKNDARFTYSWGNLETPLRQLLEERPRELLPAPERHTDWHDFLRARLVQSFRALRTDARSAELPDWGNLNRAAIMHPLHEMLRPVAACLNMSRDGQAGSQYCVRVATPRFGSTMRMIVSPGREELGSLEMPCGQSEHPLSPHFRDQHRVWADGKRLPFQPGVAVRRMMLVPKH